MIHKDNWFSIYFVVALVLGLLMLPTSAVAKKLNVVTSTTDLAALAQSHLPLIYCPVRAHLEPTAATSGGAAGFWLLRVRRLPVGPSLVYRRSLRLGRPQP